MAWKGIPKIYKNSRLDIRNKKFSMVRTPEIYNIYFSNGSMD